MSRRGLREALTNASPRAMDVTAGAVALVFSVVMALARPQWLPADMSWLWVDLACGLLAPAVIFVHRRGPVALSLVVAALTALTNPAGASAMLSVFLVGFRRPFRTAAWVALVTALAVPAQYLLRAGSFSELELVRTLVAACGFMAVMVALGGMLRTRVDLAVSLADRAERAEAARASGILAARHAERVKIAREMHDVLAQRISQLSIQAGSLTHRRSLSQEELREGLEAIRSASHEALQDLREVLGVLRDPEMPDAEDDRFRPQPSVTDLLPLLGTLRESGVVIEAHYEVEQPDRMSALCGRTLYRVAQEALTNAAKHAPGVPIELSLVAGPGLPATLAISNRLAPGREVGSGPGTRSGLIGIRERVALAGGQVLRCGPVHDSSPARFAVEVAIPWLR